MIAPNSPSGNSNAENPATKPTSDVAETNVNTLDNVDSQTTNVHSPVHCESAPNELAPNASHCLTSRNSDTPPTAETSRPSTVPDMIPVRMLNEFAYCPRLGYLEFVHAEWEDNFETKNGTFGHRRVDKADRKNIQSPIHNDQNNNDPNNTTPNNTSNQRERVGDSNSPTSTGCPTPPPAEASRPDQAARLHARSILLSAPDEGLIAKLDVMELEGRKATPVDYKRGQAPKVDEGAWEPERVQLCAQGLILRENGFECDEGILYFIGSKKRVVIPFTDELIARTRQLRTEFTKTASANITPPPLVDSPKCPRCSLVGICLPDELVYLNAQTSQQTASPPQIGTAPNSTDHDTSAPTSSSPPTASSPPTTSAIQPAVRKLLPARDDWTPFYVQEFGAMLGKSGDRLQVKKRGEVIGERRLKDVSQVSLFGSVIVSAQALSELTARGISICHFSHGGWFQGITTGLVHKNVELRIRQYQTALQPEAAVRIARQFISGKIRNCRTLLRRHLSAEHKPLLQKLERYRRSAEQTTSLESLLGIEGMAAKEYFSGLFELMRNRHEFDVNDRNRRPPKDPVNAVLSFAYSLLTKELTIVLQSVGFDPMLGMLHQPRYGRPSLALDVAEEYRPLIADSVMLTAFNNGELSSDRFLERAGAVVLTAAGRAAVIAAFERRMNTEITHPIFGYRISYRRILEVQCRLLARTLLGEIDQYPAFCTR